MKRRLLYGLLCGLFLILLYAVPASADGSDFQISSNGVLVAYNGAGGAVTIPDGVTKIGTLAFQSKAVTSVVVPEGVTEIDTNAFLNCQSLTRVTLPSTLTTLGNAAFQSCSALNSINLPSGLTSIGLSAFSGCSSLTSINIPASVTYIGDYAFRYSGLTSVTVPSTVTSMGQYVFQECRQLRTAVFNASMTTVPSYTFQSCNNLQTVSFGEGITTLNSYVCISCSSLQNISFPSTLTAISAQAFNGCSGLRNVSLPSGLTSLGSYAFANCRSLESVTIPGSLSSISSWAFYYCTGLKSLTIQQGVTAIGERAFCYCSSLEDFTLPSSISSIGAGAFYGCTSLVEMTVPGTVEIASSLFDSCTSLTTVHIGEGVHSIGACAFEYCTNLRTVDLPSTLTSIEYDAFISCMRLQSIDIPDGVSQIGDRAFANCSNLQYITLPASLTQINTSLFSNSFAFTAIEIPDGVTVIQNSAFSGCSSLNSITLPEGLYYIGSSAFANDLYLRDINLPDSLSNIADNAFTGCSSMKANVSGSGYAHDYCVDHNIPFYNRSECPDIIDVYMNGTITVGQSQTVYVVTPLNTQYLKIYNGDGMLIRTMTLTNNNGINDTAEERIWSVSTSVNGMYDMGFVFYASENGEDFGYGFGFGYSPLPAPNVLSLQLPELVRANEEGTIIATTDTNAGYLYMYDEDGNFIRSWSEGYTDNDDVRTWQVSYTFRESQNDQSFTFKATAGNDYFGEGTCTAAIHVKPTPPTVTGVRVPSGLLVGQSYSLTVTTDKKANYLLECDSTGNILRTFTTGYTENANSYVWVIDGYTATSTSAVTHYFMASADMVEFGSMNSSSVTASLPLPQITLVSAPTQGLAGDTMQVIITTETRVKYVGVYRGTTKTATRRTGYSDSGDVRTWTIPITIDEVTDDIEISLRASTNNKDYGDALTLHFRTIPYLSQVSEVIWNVKVSDGEEVPYNVTTDKRAQYIALFDENNQLIEKWTANGTLGINGDKRSWTVFHTFNGIQAGDILHLTMKASEDDVTYSGGYSVTQEVLGPIPDIISANAVADENGNIELSLTTGNNAYCVSLYNTYGNLLHTWYNGFVEVRGIRNWNLNYNLGYNTSGDVPLVLKAGNKSLVQGNPYNVTASVPAFLPDVYSSNFPSEISEGEMTSFTVTTGTRANYILLCDENHNEIAVWTSGYTENNSIRTWTLQYRFTGTLGNVHLKFRASENGTDYGSDRNVFTTIKPYEPDIYSVQMSDSITEGAPTQVTITTGTLANYIMLYDADNNLLDTWTNCYEDVGYNRRWTFTATFSGGSGSRMIRFRASSNGTAFGAYYNKSITVTDYIPDVISASMSEEVMAGDNAAITVQTTTRATGIGLFDAEDNLLTSRNTGYTDNGDVRTWTLSYAPVGTGSCSFTVKATANGSDYGSGAAVSTFVKAAPEVIRASFDGSTTVGVPTSITVVTTKTADRICMCYETGGISMTWTSGYTETEDSRVWNVSYTFSVSGDRVLTFKAAADGGRWDSGVVVNRHVYPEPPAIISTTIPSDLLIDREYSAEVVTPTTATHIKYMIEGIPYQHVLSGGYTDSGNKRTWHISFGASTVTTGGMTFSASADGVNFGAAYHVNTVFHAPVINASSVTAGTRKVVNEPVSLTVSAPSAFTYAALYEDGQLLETYQASRAADSMTVQHTFHTVGTHQLLFRVSNDDLVYGEGAALSVNITDIPADVVSCALSNTKVTNGKTITLTATTTTNAQSLTLLNGNTVVGTWNSNNATTKNGKLSWSVTFTAGNPGTYNYTVRADAANSAPGNTGALTLTVTPEPVTVQSASFAANTVVGKQTTLTVVTSSNANAIMLYAENGGLVKKWTSGYTTNGDKRTWNVVYTFASSGNRSLSVAAMSSLTTGDKKYITVNVGPAVPTITSVQFPDSVYVGDTISIRIKTDKPAKRIDMYSEGGSNVATWTSNTSKSDWSVSYTFSGSGNRRISFKASADNSNYSSSFYQDVTVGLTPSRTTAASVYGGSAVIGQNVTINVTTSASAKYVRMYAENGGLVRTWTGLQSGVTGTKVWNLDYSFNGEGYRTLTFKSSNDGERYDSGVQMNVAVNPAMPKLKSVAFNKSSAKLNTSVGITATTSSNANYLALCSENGSVCKIWAASGNSTVSGNTRTWNVSYSFGGAGNRSIGFKTAATSGNYGDIAWRSITITK